MALNPQVVLEGLSEPAREQLIAEAYLEAQRLKEEQRQRAAADAAAEAAAADTGDLRRLDWFKQHRTMIWPEVPLELEDRAFLVGLYADESPQIVVKKSSQMCISEWAITDGFWAANKYKANVLYLLPADQDVQDFSTTRVDLAVEASPFMAELMKPTRIAAEAGRYRAKLSDKKSLKRVGNRFLYFRHANVSKEGKAHQLKSIPIDLLIIDERDEMNPAAIPIAEKRLGASSLKWKRMISTPTFPDFGIDADYQLSDQRRWMVKCPHCKKQQPLDTMANLIRELDALGRPAAWFHTKGNREDVFVGCVKCEKPLTDAITSGEWVPTYQDREIHGYHVIKLVSPLTDLWELIHNGITADETERREWINQDLGEAYQPRGASYDDTMLRAVEADYALPASHPGPCAMGVDVQGEILYVVIRRYRKILDPAGVPTGELKRQAVHISAVREFDELDTLMKRYNVRRAVVDAQPEKRSATAFAARWHPKADVAYYSSTREGMKKDVAVVEKSSDKYVINLDRTRTLDDLWAEYLTGSIENPEVVDPDFKKHHKSIYRIVEKNSRGNPFAYWRNTGADDYTHADNYCNVAMDLMGAFSGGELTTTAERKPAERTPGEKPKVPIRGRDRKSTWREG